MPNWNEIEPAAVATAARDPAPSLWWLPLELDARAATELHGRAGTAPGTRPADAWLRLILAARAGCAPTLLRFAREARGRPYLCEPPLQLPFNLAHSGGHALLAVGMPRCGVDLERSARARDHLGIAARYFAPAEHAFLAQLPAAQQAAAFLRLWVAKEALLKANGLGIADGLARVHLDMGPDATLTVAAMPADTGAPQNWNVHEFVPETGYVAALAAYGERPAYSAWRVRLPGPCAG